MFSYLYQKISFNESLYGHNLSISRCSKFFVQIKHLSRKEHFSYFYSHTRSAVFIRSVLGWNPTFILFQLLVAELIVETLLLMTSSLLVALSHQCQTVVQNSPVHGNLVSRMIMSVITMMTAVTTLMNLDVVWQFNRMHVSVEIMIAGTVKLHMITFRFWSSEYQL